MKKEQELIKFTQRDPIPFQKIGDIQVVLQAYDIQQQFSSQIQNTSNMIQQLQVPSQIQYNLGIP